MIVQFNGEDRREAIINHLGLDITEEDEFIEYVKSMGYNIDAEDEIIESLYKMYSKARYGK